MILAMLCSNSQDADTQATFSFIEALVTKKLNEDNLVFTDSQEREFEIIQEDLIKIIAKVAEEFQDNDEVGGIEEGATQKLLMQAWKATGEGVNDVPIVIMNAFGNL